MSRWPALAALVMACNGGAHSKDDRSPQATPSSPMPSSAPESSPESSPESAPTTWWTGSAIAATPITATVVPAAGNPDDLRIVRTAHGVIRERVHSVVDDAGHAIIKSINGDSSGMAAAVGSPHGVLAHVDANAHETRRETFTAQLPSSLAVTTTGWLVVATEGSLEHGYRMRQWYSVPAALEQRSS